MIGTEKVIRDDQNYLCLLSAPGPQMPCKNSGVCAQYHPLAISTLAANLTWSVCAEYDGVTDPKEMDRLYLVWAAVLITDELATP